MPFNFSRRKKSFASRFQDGDASTNYGRSMRAKRIAKYKISLVNSLLLKFFAMVIFGGLVYLVLFSSAFYAKNIIIFGNKTVSENEIRQAAAAVANKKILKIFPNTLLLLKTVEVQNSIKSRFGNIDDVKAIKFFPQALKIEIIEKPTDIAWCNWIKIERVVEVGKKSESSAPVYGEQNRATEASQCYFSDENNAIYKKADDELAGGSIKVFRDDRIAIGGKIGDNPLKNFIRELAANFNRRTGLGLAYLYLPAFSSRELHLATGDGWKIYFDLNRNIDDQLWILASALKSKIPDSDKKIMDYIDLRVIDRVNYKTK